MDDDVKEHFKEELVLDNVQRGRLREVLIELIGQSKQFFFVRQE